MIMEFRLSDRHDLGLSAAWIVTRGDIMFFMRMKGMRSDRPVDIVEPHGDIAGLRTSRTRVEIVIMRPIPVSPARATTSGSSSAKSGKSR